MCGSATVLGCSNIVSEYVNACYPVLAASQKPGRAHMAVRVVRTMIYVWRRARRQCKLKTDVIVNHGVDTELRRVAESDPPYSHARSDWSDCQLASISSQ
jgi:hypothetical protein